MMKKFHLCLFVAFLVLLFFNCSPRKTERFEWGNLRNLGPHINSSARDEHATLTQDGQTMYFASTREPAKPHSVQIFQSTWLGKRWSQPEALPAPVNSGGWEATPYIIPDGKTLYLNSGRGEEDKKDVDIWRFDFIDGRWTNPRLMNGPFLSDKHDYDPCLSPDGKKFYFTSNRDGGFGDSDIYVVEKILTVLRLMS